MAPANIPAKRFPSDGGHGQRVSQRLVKLLMEQFAAD
jgi:hypothetical protein